MRKLAVIVAVLCLVSCKKDSEEEKIIYSAWPILKVEGANTGTVDQVIPITVTFPSLGNCNTVDKFAEFRSGTSVNITLLGYTVSPTCISNGLPQYNIIYNFKATTPGVYELRFANNDAIIAHVVTVN